MLPILNKPLVIFAGKGGVGKTTLSASFALLAHRYNKKVLIVELNTEEKIPYLFGSEKVGYRTREIYQNIFSINITPEDALQEYGLIKLKFKTAYKLVFENELMKKLLKVIPGMNELLLIGKIWYLVKEIDRKKKDYQWDIIIVDTPATGKGFSILRLPKTILEVISYGPLASDTKPIFDLLMDEKRTCMNIITTPEELPVSESIELIENVKNLGISIGFLIANGVYKTHFNPVEMKILSKCKSIMRGTERDLDELIKTSSFLINRSKMQKIHLDKLSTQAEEKIIYIPFIPFIDSPLKQLTEISIHLEKEIERLQL